LQKKKKVKINRTKNHTRIPSPIETTRKNPAALYNAKISQLDLIQFISSKLHSQKKKKVALFKA